jgi:hypothetical protein
MKKTLAIVALVSSFLLASPASGAETVKGMIVKVDGAARTITFRKDRADQDEVLPVDASVKLDGVKANAKARLTVDGGVVKAVEPEKARAAGY